MQHIYSHAQNLGNECADHAAALGAFGLVSNQDMSARWARPLFGMSWINYVMLELREHLPLNTGAGFWVSFHTGSLRDLPCFHVRFLDPLLFCRLAQSMQTPPEAESLV